MIKRIIYSNAVWSLASNGLAAILGFVNIAFIAHHYSTAQAGQWFMLLTIYTLLEMFRSGWVQTPYVRYFAATNSEYKQGRLTAAAWQLLLFFTLALCVLLLPLYFFKWGEGAFGLAQKYTVIWLISALPYQLLQWQLQARAQFKKLAVVRLIFPAAFAALLILKPALSIQYLVLCYAIFQLVPGLTGFLLGWLKAGVWNRHIKHERRKLLGFGKYSMLTMIASSLLRSSDNFIIAAILGPAAVAVYSVPQKLVEAIEVPVRSLASVAVVKATKLWQTQQLDELRIFFYRQCGLLSVLILPLLIIFIAFPGAIVGLMGGAKYAQSGVLLQIFCFYAALIPLDRYCGLLLDASHRPQKNTIKVSVMLGVNIAGDLLALYLGAGLYGVAAVSTLTFLMGIILGWLQLKDILKVFQPRTFWHEGVVSSINQLKNHQAI